MIFCFFPVGTLLNPLLEYSFYLIIHGSEVPPNYSYRSSHWRCSVKKGVLKNVKFTGKHLFSFLIKLQAEALWQRCFPVNLAKLLTTHFLQNAPGRLLLFLQMTFQHISLIFGNFWYLSVVVDKKTLVKDMMNWDFVSVVSSESCSCFLSSQRFAFNTWPIMLL